MGIFAHENNEEQIVAGAGKGDKPYLSPGLSGAYKHRHWTVEIVIGVMIAFIGIIFVIVHVATASGPADKDNTFLWAGICFAGFGGLLVLLGLCWYKNQQPPKPPEDGSASEMNSLNVESAVTQQTGLIG